MIRTTVTRVAADDTWRLSSANATAYWFTRHTPGKPPGYSEQRRVEKAQFWAAPAPATQN